MHFKLSLFAVALATAAPAIAQVTAQQVVSNIDAITSASSDLNEVAKSVSLINSFQTGPQVIDGFKNIVTTATNDVSAMGGGGSKKRRRYHPRQIEDPEAELSDVLEIVKDPSEILGDKTKRQASAPYSDTDQQAICSSLREFVNVHQDLLRTVIGKHGVLEIVGFGAQVGAVLRGVEGVVDELAFDIIGTVPTCAQDATQNKNSLDQTLTSAVDAYNN